MQDLNTSLDCLLSNANKLIEKIEKCATENLVKGETDKVTLLVNARQLSMILKQIELYGRPCETNGKAVDFDNSNQ